MGAARRRPGHLVPGLDAVIVAECGFGLLGIGDPRPIDEMLRRDVFADRTPPEEAGADGHARRKVGVEAGGAGAAAAVDGDPQGIHRGGKGHDGLGVLAMDRRRMAGAAQSDQGPAHGDAALGVGHAMEAQHGAQLLPTERLFRHGQVERRQQDPGFCGSAEARFLGDPACILADRRGVESVLGKQIGAQLIPFLVTAKMRTLALQMAQQLVGDGILHYQHGFIGAEDRVVERLAGDDPLGRLGQIRRGVDEDRRIAGTDADGRVAGTIGRAHHGRTAGGQDHVHLRLHHQRLDQFDGRLLDHLDHAVGCAGLHRRVMHHLRRIGGAGLGQGMGADQDGVARQQRAHDLEIDC